MRFITSGDSILKSYSYICTDYYVYIHVQTRACAACACVTVGTLGTLFVVRYLPKRNNHWGKSGPLVEALTCVSICDPTN